MLQNNLLRQCISAFNDTECACNRIPLGQQEYMNVCNLIRGFRVTFSKKHNEYLHCYCPSRHTTDNRQHSGRSILRATWTLGSQT